MGAKLFAIRVINLILKTKFRAEAIPINPKRPKEIKDEGTCTYIILTESPWMQSGGEINNAYNNPTKTTKIIRMSRLIISLLLDEIILLGRKYLNI